MSMLGNLIRRVMPRAAAPDTPALPKPRERYVLTSSDMVHFDLLDGDEECGGVELKDEGGNDPNPWAVHVYGIDLKFSSFGKARKWLGKPPVQIEQA